MLKLWSHKIKYNTATFHKISKSAIHTSAPNIIQQILKYKKF